MPRNTVVGAERLAPDVSRRIEAAQVLRRDYPRRAEQLVAPDAARCAECGESRTYCGHRHA